MAFDGLIATLPIGASGLTGNRNLHSIGPEDLLQAENVTYEQNVLQKIGGLAVWNTTPVNNDATAAMLAGADFQADDTTQLIVVAAQTGNPTEARIYSSTILGKDFTVEEANNLIAGSPSHVFVRCGSEEGGNTPRLAYFNGVDVVQFKNGTTTPMVPISSPAADWTGTNQPMFGVVHDQRLWAAGNANAPDRLYYSLATNHRNFFDSDAGSLSIFPGTGGRLIGGVSYKGLLIVFKSPAGIYAVDTSGADVTQWRVTELNPSIGAASHNSIVTIGQDDAIAWMDTAGVFRVARGVDEFGDMATTNVMEPRYLESYVQQQYFAPQFSLTQGAFYPAKNQALWRMAVPAPLRINSRFVMDFTGGRLRFATEQETAPIENVSLFPYKGTDAIVRLLIGGQVGQLYTLDEPAYNRNGLAYTATLQTPHTNFGFLDQALAARRKNGVFIELLMEPSETADVDIYWDQVLKQTLTGVQANELRRIQGSGTFFSAVLRQAGLNETFHPSAIRVYFTVGPQRKAA